MAEDYVICSTREVDWCPSNTLSLVSAAAVKRFSSPSLMAGETRLKDDKRVERVVQEYSIFSSGTGKSADLKTESEEELQEELEKLKVELETLVDSETDGFTETDGLGSLIFGCTDETYDECILKKIFGFSDTLLPLVQLVKPGMPVFLFNFQTRIMFGLFQAVTEGTMNIDPHAWTGTFCSSGIQTKYPAQVRVKLVSSRIMKLEEEVFREAIERNYFMPGRFYFHLDRRQTDSLIHKFNSSLHTKCLTLPRQQTRHQTCEMRPPVECYKACTTLKPQTVVSAFNRVVEPVLPDFRRIQEHLRQTYHELRCKLISVG